MTSYFDRKASLKANIKYTYRRQRQLDSLITQYIARNIYIDHIYNQAKDQPLYTEAQEVKTAALEVMRDSAQLITLLQSMITDLVQLQTYYVSLIKQLID